MWSLVSLSSSICLQIVVIVYSMKGEKIALMKYDTVSPSQLLMLCVLKVNSSGNKFDQLSPRYSIYYLHNENNSK